MYNLTAALGIRDCASYLPEWIEFHLLQGFEHFTFYNQFSTDGIHELLKSYVDEGIVTIIDLPQEMFDQASGWKCLNNILERGREHSKWVWIASMDEYMFLPNGGKVIDILPEYEDYAALAIQWVLYNSSGHQKRTPGLVLERFTQTYDEYPLHCKTIMQPKLTRAIQDPHSIIPIPGYIPVDENKKYQPSPHPLKFSANKIRINHYFSMSREEFVSKMEKGRADLPGAESKPRDNYEQYWEKTHNQEPKYDRCLADSEYVKIIKENLIKRFGEEKKHLVGM